MIATLKSIRQALSRAFHPSSRKMALEFLKRYLFALSRVPLLFTLGVTRKNDRLFISEICRHFGYFRRLMDIPSIPVEEALPDYAEVHLHCPTATDGNLNLFDLAVLTEIVRRHQPRNIFEIGTFDGRTALNMAAYSPADAHIYTLDLPATQVGATAFPLSTSEKAHVDKTESGTRFRHHPLGARITQLYGDSATFDFTPYKNKMDLIFVDGAHTYEYVLSDTAKALDLLRDGQGIIIWHDYPWIEGVIRALNGIHRTEPRLAGMRHIAGTYFVYWNSRTGAGVPVAPGHPAGRG